MLESELTLLLDVELLGAEELLSLEFELLDSSELDEDEDSLDVLLEEDEPLSKLLASPAKALQASSGPQTKGRSLLNC